MDFLNNRIVEIWTKEQKYKELKYLGSDKIYIMCMEKDGMIRLFNHKIVEQIVCKNYVPIKTDDIEASTERDIFDHPDVTTYGSSFIPERQTQAFRLDEMRRVASGEIDLTISSNLGVVEPRG